MLLEIILGVAGSGWLGAGIMTARHEYAVHTRRWINSDERVDSTERELMHDFRTIRHDYLCNLRRANKSYHNKGCSCDKRKQWGEMRKRIGDAKNGVLMTKPTPEYATVMLWPFYFIAEFIKAGGNVDNTIVKGELVHSKDIPDDRMLPAHVSNDELLKKFPKLAALEATVEENKRRENDPLLKQLKSSWEKVDEAYNADLAAAEKAILERAAETAKAFEKQGSALTFPVPPKGVGGGSKKPVPKVKPIPTKENPHNPDVCNCHHCYEIWVDKINKQNADKAKVIEKHIAELVKPEFVPQYKYDSMYDGSNEIIHVIRTWKDEEGNDRLESIRKFTSWSDYRKSDLYAKVEQTKFEKAERAARLNELHLNREDKIKQMQRNTTALERRIQKKFGSDHNMAPRIGTVRGYK